MRGSSPELGFDYGALPVRVIFGLGAADRKLAGVVDDLGVRRALVIVSEAVVVIAPHSPRTFVARLDFLTTVGHGDGPGARERLGFRGAGPTAVITDLGVLEPDPATKELTLTEVHEGVEIDQVRAATGWALRVADTVTVTERPTAEELGALRELTAR
jgi:acyl CoA:acetate/3-ketoacid CoA transferase beta subunit